MVVGAVLAFMLATTQGPAPTDAAAAPMVRPLPGLWKLSGSLSYGKQVKWAICIGSGLPPAWKQADETFANPPEKGCAATKSRQGEESSVVITCKIRVARQTFFSKMAMTAGERRLHMTIDTWPKPGSGAQLPASHTDTDAVYAGACPASLKEGQMQDEDGTIVDLGTDLGIK